MTRDEVRCGLIGAGDIARKRVAAALRDAPGETLTAVSRARADLAESFAKSFGAERRHARWEDLVRDPGIDAVYLATNFMPGYRAFMTKYNADHGIASTAPSRRSPEDNRMLVPTDYSPLR